MRVDLRTREMMMRMNWTTSTTLSLLRPMKMKTMQTTTEPTTRGRTEVRTAGKTSMSRRKIYSHESCKCKQYASLSRDLKLPVNAYFFIELFIYGSMLKKRNNKEPVLYLGLR